MFRNAIRKASAFTAPIVASTRYFDGTVESGCATMTLLNADGWFATAAHVLNQHLKMQADQAAIAAYQSGTAGVGGGTGQTAPDPKWITNHSIWWGADNVTVPTIHYHMELDLAVGRLVGFPAPQGIEYPRLKNAPGALDEVGRSLCRLGFPFTRIASTFDPATQRFTLAPGSLPLPRFPLEGMMTRNIDGGRTRDNLFDIRFIETSSPGLRGQSGGPLFDADAQLWGIQSRTMHYPLGFSPTVSTAGGLVEEHQFFNAGLAVHPATIKQYLDAKGVQIDVA